MNPAATLHGQLPAQLENLTGSIGAIVPELLLAGVFLLMMVAEIVFGKRHKVLLPTMATLGIAISSAWLIFAWNASFQDNTFLGMVQPDGFSGVFRLLFGLAAALTLWVSYGSGKLKSNSSGGLGEYYLVMMAMLVGLNFMSMASNLLMMYLALEMVSIPSYILTAYTRLNRNSAEASLKYVLYGAFSSGIMLYGISWLYGLTGTLDPFHPGFGESLTIAGPMQSTFVIALVLCGFAFKVSALPFHFWTPDVYEGAPYPITAFFAVAPKAAGFAMLMRFLLFLPTASPDIQLYVQVLLALIAAGTMTLGNLAAIRQENVRRLLAWSSVAQAGYILMGVLVISITGYAAATFYLIIYFFMTFGAFALAGWLYEKTGTENLQDYKGLAKGLPLATIVVVVFMVSLTGLPPTAGFIGKLDLFLAAIEHYAASGNDWIIWLLVFAVVNTVISLFYYLRIPVLMVFHNPVIKITPAFHGFVPWLTVVLSIPVIWLGIISFDGLINFLREQILPLMAYIP